MPKDIGFLEMQEIQNKMAEKYGDKWTPPVPQKGREMLLWMMTEAGEVADVIKKKGDAAIMEDSETRNHFVEEMCDVMMCFNELMQCYSITPEELRKAYIEKFEKNMKRW